MKTTKILTIAIGVCIFLAASVLPVKAFNENLLLYLSFDSGDAKVARDLTGKTKGGDHQRRREDCSRYSRQSAGTGRRKRVLGD